MTAKRWATKLRAGACASAPGGGFFRGELDGGLKLDQEAGHGGGDGETVGHGAAERKGDAAGGVGKGLADRGDELSLRLMRREDDDDQGRAGDADDGGGGARHGDVEDFVGRVVGVHRDQHGEEAGGDASETAKIGEQGGGDGGRGHPEREREDEEFRRLGEQRDEHDAHDGADDHADDAVEALGDGHAGRRLDYLPHSDGGPERLVDLQLERRVEREHAGQPIAQAEGEGVAPCGREEFEAGEGG